MVADLDRLFHTLDGKPPPSHLADAANLVNKASYAHEEGCESEYFRFKLYLNGNLHIVFKRTTSSRRPTRSSPITTGRCSLMRDARSPDIFLSVATQKPP